MGRLGCAQTLNMMDDVLLVAGDLTKPHTYTSEQRFTYEKAIEISETAKLLDSRMTGGLTCLQCGVSKVLAGDHHFLPPLLLFDADPSVNVDHLVAIIDRIEDLMSLSREFELDFMSVFSG